MQNRPFEDAGMMDRDLMRNYNMLVHKNGIVYICGDICHASLVFN